MRFEIAIDEMFVCFLGTCTIFESLGTVRAFSTVAGAALSRDMFTTTFFGLRLGSKVITL